MREPEWWADARRLRAKGLTDCEISKKLGRHRNSVCYVFNNKRKRRASMIPHHVRLVFDDETATEIRKVARANNTSLIGQVLLFVEWGLEGSRG
jgi:orotate phosphoribosyltransferase-like protein